MSSRYPNKKAPNPAAIFNTIPNCITSLKLKSRTKELIRVFAINWLPSGSKIRSSKSLVWGFLSFSVNSEFVHYLILLFALPISILALGLGYKNHKETSYFIIGVTGLMVLLSAVLFSDTLFGEAGERTLTLIGSMIVAYAHYKNHSICKQIECDCHDNLKSN